jgi:Zn finger protein HypA/HybF involved in hydrogenase expression
LGRTSQAFLEALQRHSGALATIEQAKSDAVEAEDSQAYREALEREARVYVEARDAIGGWDALGVAREDYPEVHVASQMPAFEQLVEMQASRTPEGAFVETDFQQQLGQLTQEYQQALAEQDVHAFAEAWRDYMGLTLRQNAGGEIDEETLDYQIRGSMENMLRDQPWVTAEDLEALGFDTLHDARSTDDGAREVDCQNCGAPIEVEPAEETVECPYCEATTHLQLTSSDVLEKFSQGRGEASATGRAEGAAGGGGDWTEELSQARQTVASSFDVDAESPRADALTYYMFAQMYDHALTDEARGQVRDELGLGEPVTCSTCSERFYQPRAPLKVCPICAQQL